MENNFFVELYTDGAAKGNPGPGGYGAVLISRAHNLRKEFSGGYRLTTNNRMELMAVIVGLEALKNSGTHVKIYSDSQYVIDSVNKKWLDSWVNKHFKNKKNRDLWERVYELKNKHKTEWFWIRGHNGHPLNEYCDRLAVAESEKSNLPPDVYYEQNAKNEAED
jgi:ribonuclease HI